MNLELRIIQDLEEALALAPRMDAWAAESTAEFRDDALPRDVGRTFVETHFQRPECLILVAEDKSSGQNFGTCVVGPFADPLTAETVPMVVLLWVDPSLRHRGVARALVVEARRLLRQRGFDKLAARAGHNDDALISMGERWGFLRHWELLLYEG